MASGDRSVRCGTAFRIGAALLCAALLTGCFQPLYGRHSAAGGPGVRDALSAVRVLRIDAPHGSSLDRLAVQTQNELIFALTGGGAPADPTHELSVRLTANRSTVIVDRNSQRPDVEIAALEASYSLKERATGKIVVTAHAFARVSYDIPGSEQRFARIRGLRDAQDRATKELAMLISARLASYFAAGT